MFNNRKLDILQKQLDLLTKDIRILKDEVAELKEEKYNSGKVSIIKENVFKEEDLIKENIVEEKEIIQANTIKEDVKKENIVNEVIKDGNLKNEEFNKTDTDKELEYLKQKSSMGFEEKVGGKLTNIIGILFILCGIILGFNYTYKYLLTSDLAKSLLAYAIGIIFIGAGEVYGYKKKYNYFSLGLIAGGISVLFASTGMSYLMLGLIGSIPAFFICIAIALFALGLSLKHNAEIISIFGIIGGYLPIAVMDKSLDLNFSLITYMIFAVIIMIATIKKKWTITKYIALIAHFICLSIILDHSPINHLAMIYLYASFVIYLGFIFAYPIIKKENLGVLDIGLMILNTLFTFVLVEYIRDEFNHGDIFNLSYVNALIMFIIYALLTGILKYIKSEDKYAVDFSFITAIVFLAITTLAYFDKELVTLIWVIEGTALLSYGMLRNHKLSARCGFSLLIFGIVTFYSANIVDNIFNGYDSIEFIKHVVVSALIIALVILNDIIKPTVIKHVDKLKNFGIFNLWILIIRGFDLLFRNIEFAERYNSFLIEFTVISLATYILLWAIYKFDKEKTKGRDILLSSICIIHLLGVLVLMGSGRKLKFMPEYMCLLILVISSIYMSYVLAEIMEDLSNKKKNLKPYIVGFYSLLVIVTITKRQLSGPYTNLIISLIMLSWAFSMIVFGFMKKEKGMRHSGLVLSLLSIAKLFFVDLMYTSEGQRIIAYITFGLIFIGISYFYQRYSKEFENKYKDELK